MTFYIRVRGKVQGPFDVERLKSLARRGRFSRSYEVSTDRVSWSRAQNFPELFPDPPPLPARAVALPGGRSGATAASAEDADWDAFTEELANDEELVLEPAEPAWHYARNAQKFGPVAFQDLQQMASSGKLLPEDLVWSDELPTWTAAHRVAGLFTTTSAGHPANSPAPRGAAHGAMTGPGNPASLRVAPMSVACLVLALLGLNVLYLLPFSLVNRIYPLIGLSVLLVLASVLAIVFGHIALQQIKQSAETLAGGGMVIAGLILGYFVIIAVTVVAIVVGFIVALGGSIVTPGGTSPP